MHREVGGGRIPRQPGQVRKEAALTIRTRVVRQPPLLLVASAFGHGCRHAHLEVVWQEKKPAQNQLHL